jgi:hypothetical protein
LDYQVIFEGVYTLHPAIRKSLDLWIAVVSSVLQILYKCWSSRIFLLYLEINSIPLYQFGGVHSHLIARIQRDKNRAGFSISQSEIMTTVFPLFQQYIEPHLVDAHVGTRDMSIISLFNLCHM